MTEPTPRRLVAPLLLLAAMTGHAQAADDPSGGLFRDRVAPVLAGRCVGCHRPGNAKGGLSLADAPGLKAGGESGPAVEPGKPEESLLVEMLTGETPEMPKQGGPLAPEQVEALRAWISQGAHWPEGLVLKEPGDGGTWWSLKPLARPPVPSLDGGGWARTPVDAFILQGLAARGLTPSAEAGRGTLIRRLTFDLHGLPPTPEEVDTFAADPAPDAYERLVDRLLASPRYGERWGRHWLDVVHYGDTHGYDKDKKREHAWRYRDYVIGALNDDIPYGQFVREQVAGDVLNPGDPRGQVATGFIAAGPWDFVGQVELREGTVDKEKTRVLDRDDMVASTVSTFVSLTAHCARCHDHKFDPISQADYYRLQAVFAGVERGNRPVARPDIDRMRGGLERQRAGLIARKAGIVAEVGRRSGANLEALDGEIAALRAQLESAADPAAASPTNGYHSEIGATADVTKWVQVDLGRVVPIDEVRLIPARPTDFRDAPGFGFPRRFRVEIADEPAMTGAANVADHSSEDVPNPGERVVAVPGGGRRGRFVRVTAVRLWERTADYVFALGELEVIADGRNVAAGATVSSLDSIEGGRWGRASLVDGFDSRTKLSDPATIRRSKLMAEVRRAEADRGSKLEAATLPAERAELSAIGVEVASIDRQIKELPGPDAVYGVVSRAPRPIHRLNRGDVEQPAEAVEPGALPCLELARADFSVSDSANEGARRAALAEWLSSPRNALAWRSIANRVWHYHFGRGLVDTPNDFGRNGSKPTHPELLDWLATELIDNGQSLKRLHRLIVTSAVYRQVSGDDAGKAEIDGDSRYLWRMSRRRLDAESLRDSVLTVAGAMDPMMGGPGFSLFRFKDDHSPIYDHESPGVSDPPEGRRRAVYRFVVRSVPNPFIECMDGADPNANTPARSTTITALQALALMNDPFMLAQAKRFASRVEAASPDGPGRADVAHRIALGRPARADEQAALAAYAARHGWANACRILLNSNEFVFID
ncbi:PSD1 and planctomycete cytochrome C domain-containing protein [Isosphaeraceae bacterium EP7]